MNESQMHATYFIIYIKSIRSGYIPYKNISKILSYSSLNMHPEGANNLWLNNVNRWVVQHLQIAIQNKKSPKVCTFLLLISFQLFHFTLKMYSSSLSFIFIFLHFDFLLFDKKLLWHKWKMSTFRCWIVEDISSQSTISSPCLAFS